LTDRTRLSIGLLLLAGATELVVFSDGHGPIRLGLVLAFLFVAPGWALVRLIGLEMSPMSRIGLALGVSIAIDMAAASIILYARIWSAELALTLVVAVVVLAVLLDLPPSRRSIQGAVGRVWAGLSGLGRI
jgi:hypothetical protein